MSNEFNTAKQALLSNYNTQQTTLSERLIGFVVAIFAFLALSKISNLNFGIYNHLSLNNLNLIDLMKPPLFFFGILLLSTVIVWSLFRYSVYSQMSYELLKIQEKDVLNYLKVKETDMYYAMHNIICKELKGRKILLGRIEILCFVRLGTKDDKIWKGSLISVILGFVASFILFILLL